MSDGEKKSRPRFILCQMSAGPRRGGRAANLDRRRVKNAISREILVLTFREESRISICAELKGENYNMKNKILVIQHESDTPAGTTLVWAAQRGVDIEFWYPATTLAPKVSDIENLLGVVICGGSMDTFEEEQFPWLKAEKEFIRNLLEKKIKIFGLCLGSQLLAEALGGKVYRYHGWEVGFVSAEDSQGQKVPMFHWHQCSFELPPSAQLIIEGEYCRNQAFTWGDQVVATQFHPEATVEWIRECAEEVREKHQGNVQSKEEILNSLDLQKDLQAWYFKQLDGLFFKS